MNILLISTEAYPYSKPGGLADVVHGLARSLRVEAEQDVRILMPLYRGKLNPNEMQLVVKDLDVPMGYYSRSADLWKANKPFPVYLLQHEFYFERDAFYGYLDDYERFIFFTRSALQILRSPQFRDHEDKWFPDILHGFNGLTGLMPYWLAHDPLFANSRFVLTIHNMDAPGVYGARALLVSEQAKNGTYSDLGENRQQINFLGRGLNFADRIGMVNPYYGQPKDIKDDSKNANHDTTYNPLPRPLRNLRDVLDTRLDAGEICSIRNGIDEQTYDPATDAFLVQTFTHRSLELRNQNKLAFQQQAGLAVDSDLPLLAMIGRMQTARGYDHLEALKATLFDRGDVQLVILGEPENRRYLDMFEAWESEWRSVGWNGKKPWFQVYCDFDEKRARQIYASCDLLLIPALELPSGTQQYIAMHYGAIPVVHRTGALYNSVEPYISGVNIRNWRGSGVGVGFAYEGDGDQFLASVQAALSLYRTDRKVWHDIQRHNMREDFSWTEPAEKYLELYQTALQSPRRGVWSGETLPTDPNAEGTERLLQAVREIDRLPGMRARDIHYMLKHTARLIRWVIESRTASADVYVWVTKEYLQKEYLQAEVGVDDATVNTEEALDVAYPYNYGQERMRVVSSLWRDAAGRHLPDDQRNLETQAENLLNALSRQCWPSASDWLASDEPPLDELCQPLPNFHSNAVAQAKGWFSGWSAIIVSHSRVMGRIDVLFPIKKDEFEKKGGVNKDKENEVSWIVSALSTLSTTIGLRLEAVRFALEKDQALDLSTRMMNAHSLIEVLDGVREIVLGMTPAEQAWVYLMEDNVLRAIPDVPTELSLAGIPYADEAIIRADSVYVSDWLNDSRRPVLKDNVNLPYLRALIATPLLKKTNHQIVPIGVLVVASRRPAVFSFDQQRWLSKLLAPQAAAALDTFRQLEHRERQRAEYLSQLESNRAQQLQNLANSLLIGGDFDQLLKAIVSTTATELKARTASLYLYDKARDRLFLEATAGYHEELEKLEERANYQLGEGVTGYIAQQTEIVRANSLDELKERVPSYEGKYLQVCGQHEPNAFLGIPLYIGSRGDDQRQVIGVLKVEDRKPGVEPKFSQQDELLAQMMGNVIATVIHNIQVSQSQLNTLSDNLQTLSKVLVGASDLNALLQQTVETIAALVGGKASSLYLVDKNTNQLVIQAASGYQKILLKHSPPPSYPPGYGVTGWIWQEGKEFKADNYAELHAHPAWRGKQDDIQGQLPTSFFGLPLIVTDRYSKQLRVIGVLKIEDVKITPSHPEDYFTTQDVLLVKMMANVIATVVYNTQLSRSQLNTLRDNLSKLSQVLAGGSEMDTLLKQIVKTIAELMGAKASSLYLVDESKNEIVIQAASGYQEILLEQDIRPSYPPGYGVTGWIWQEGKPFKADNYAELHAHPAWRGKQDDIQGQLPSSFFGLPLTVTDRYSHQPRVIGVMKIEDIKSRSSHPE